MTRREAGGQWERLRDCRKIAKILKRRLPGLLPGLGARTQPPESAYVRLTVPVPLLHILKSCISIAHIDRDLQRGVYC